MLKYILIIFFTVFVAFLLKAQDNNNADSIQTEYIESSFWTTRIINGHSIENLGKGEMDFRISHRMGRIDDGPKKLFGLFTANSQLGLEYGISDRLMAGIAAASNQYTYTGFFKYKILRQSTGKRNVPLTLSWYSGIETISADLNYPDDQYYFSQRLSYVHQLLIGRKFNENLSLQLTPVLVHKNIVKTKKDKNNIFALGFSGRYKITKKLALTFEYFAVFPDQVKSGFNNMPVTNSLSVGFDIYTGKHVFQIFVSNSTTMNEKSFITETNEKWDKGNIHIGFNIARVFTVLNNYE